MKRPVTLLQSILFSATVLAGAMTNAWAVTTTPITVPWTGSNNFNDSSIEFHKFLADQLIDIYGSGRYEGCCNDKSTSFTLDLYFNSHWNTVLKWTADKTKDESPQFLGELVPKVITFADTPVYISGIRLTSNPNGKPSNDYNYNNFNFVTYLSRDEYYELNKSKYKSRKDYDDCDDYEHYVRNITSFVFCSNCSSTTSGEPLPTPLPAALPLMGSVLGGFGVAMWRRRRKRCA